MIDIKADLKRKSRLHIVSCTAFAAKIKRQDKMLKIDKNKCRNYFTFRLFLLLRRSGAALGAAGAKERRY